MWIGLIVGCGRSCDGLEQTDPGGGQVCLAPPLTDHGGGQLLLRGVNISAEAKWAVDHLPPIEPNDLLRLRDSLGLNAIRLLVFWQAIEPFPGVFDREYLSAVRTIVDAAETADLVVLVDMHQDLFGDGFGQAGAPRWACDETYYATYNQPDLWLLGYVQPEIVACFDGFYHDTDLRASFAAAWAELAKALAGAPAIFAYEVLNEPFWGSATSQEFDRVIGPDLYAEVGAVIRSVDPDPWLAIEPAPTASVGLPSELMAPEQPRLLYAPHFYPPAIELGHGYDGKVQTLRHHASVICADGHRLGVPVVIGELGVRRDVPGFARYLEDAYDALDEAHLSVFYWDHTRGGRQSYGLYDESGEPAEQGELVARPYPARVAGSLTRFYWDREDGEFVVEWQEDGAVTGETVLSLPELAFPDGADALIDGTQEIMVAAGRLAVAQVGGPRQVRVRRRPPPPVSADAGVDEDLAAPVSPDAGVSEDLAAPGPTAAAAPDPTAPSPSPEPPSSPAPNSPETTQAATTPGRAVVPELPSESFEP